MARIAIFISGKVNFRENDITKNKKYVHIDIGDNLSRKDIYPKLVYT